MKNQMKRHIRILAKSAFTLIPILIISSGCATPLKTVMKSYQAAPTCCESMKDFRFETIVVGDSKSFILNETSPAYLFDTGKSFFKAFALPQFSYPYHVSVKSYMLGQTRNSWYIFYPKVITLNKDFEVVRSTDSRSFQFQRAGFIETAKETFGMMYKIEGHISFTEENKAERYLIILTTDELLRGNTFLVSEKFAPIVLPGLVTAVPTGNKEVMLVPRSPSGRINISVLRHD